MVLKTTAEKIPEGETDLDKKARELTASLMEKFAEMVCMPSMRAIRARSDSRFMAEFNGVGVLPDVTMEVTNELNATLFKLRDTRDVFKDSAGSSVYMSFKI